MAEPRVVAIIQARMGSSRLPGKVLLPLAGKPALWHVVDRLSRCELLDEIVIATTVEKADDAIEEFCRREEISCFRGSEDDVLDRYYQAARKFEADHIVRITADCPVIDPVIVDEVVEGFLEGVFDIYGLSGEHPDGLDCTVYSFKALEEAFLKAKLPSEREHVGPFIEKNPQLFKPGSYRKFTGLGHHRWTLDEENDYRFLTEVFDRLYDPGKNFLTQDILNLLKREPELMTINQGIIRNEGYLKSLEEDKNLLGPKRK